MTIELTIDGVCHEWELADHWDELTDKQWRWALMLLSKSWSSRMLRDYRKALCVLCNGDKAMLELLNGLDEGWILGMVESITWLNEPPVQFKSKVKWYMGWKGPADDLRNLNMEQLGFVQQFVALAKAADKDEDMLRWLRYLMATVYTPMGLPYRSWMVPVYAWMMRVVPTKVLLWNMTNVHAMLCGLREHYEWVYDEDNETDENRPQHGFRALLTSLAGTKFGDFYQVKKAKLHDVMVHMDLNAYETHKMMKQSNKID